MHRILPAVLLASLAVLVPCRGDDLQLTDEEAALRTRFSECVGLQIGSQIRELRLDKDAVMAAVEAALAGEKQALADEEVRPIATEFMNRVLPKIMDRQGGEWKASAGLPAEEHDAFYAAYIKREGVTVTPSGLAYEVLEPADGPKPTAADKVKVHYTGRLTTGRVFDSSVQRGTPAEFPVQGVIKGWIEGLQLMPVGSKYRFVIPADLAYGPRKEGSRRPTGILVFDVELLEIIK